jgi:biotin transport system permease protein
MTQKWLAWQVKMLTLTSDFKTALHAVPVGPKLLVLAGFSLWVAFVQGWPLVVLGLGGVSILYLAQGWSFARQGLLLLRPLWPFLLLLALWHCFSYTKLVGAILAGKMVAMVALANIVTLTSRFDALLAAIEKLFAPLHMVGLSPRILALTLALVIRFTPVLLDKAGLLRQAWRARSHRAPSWQLILPLAALDDADHVALALRARGGFIGKDLWKDK